MSEWMRNLTGPAPVTPGMPLFGQEAQTAVTPEAEGRLHGSDYVPARDMARLTGVMARVFAVMSDSAARTTEQIAEEILARFDKADRPESINRMLRYLKRPEHGGHAVDKTHLGGGLYEYRLIARQDGDA